MERRPIRDALPAFQMSRGRLRYGPAVSFGDLAEAITIWDVDTDEEPGTAVKACPAITCEAELEAEVQAIVKCITIGNFQARYNPEFFAANLQALNVAFDAAAETQLFNQILAGSTAATTVDYGKGTVTNVLANLDLLAAGMRGSLRLPQGVTLDVILPDWIESALRSHLVNQPAHYAGQFDATGGWFAARNLRPIFSPDISLFSDPDDVTAVPATMPFVIYPNGTWVYGDGGTLDLGVVRDLTNATNDLQVFAEGFEVALKRGCALPGHHRRRVGLYRCAQLMAQSPRQRSRSASGVTARRLRFIQEVEGPAAGSSSPAQHVSPQPVPVLCC